PPELMPRMAATRQGRVRIQAAHSAARNRRHRAWAEPPGWPTLARTRTATTGRSAAVPASSCSGSSVRWRRMACRSARLSGRTDPLARSSSSNGHGRALAIGILLSVVLAGGPLRATPATLLVSLRPVGPLAAHLSVVGAASCPLLGLDALDGRPGPLSSGSLCPVGRLWAQGPVRIGYAVGVPVLLDLGGGLAPGPPTPGRLRHRPQDFQDIRGPIGLDGQACGTPPPGKGPNDLPILRTEMCVGFQPALAALLVLTQLPLPVMSPVDLLGGHRQPTRDPGRLLAAAQPAKHAAWLVPGGRLVGGHGFLGLLPVTAGPGQLAAAVAGGLVELLAEPVALGPQLGRGQPLEVGAAGGVDGQALAAGPGQGLGQLQVAIGLLPIGEVQLSGPLGFGADHRVQAGVLAGPGQLDIEPVHVLAAGK